LVGKYTWKRRLGRPRNRWEVNIKSDLTKIICEDRIWIKLAQDCDHVSGVQNQIKFWKQMKELAGH